MSSSKIKKQIKEVTKSPADKVHPWRLCPTGEHGVVTHPLKVPPSEKSPSERVTTRHFHCAKNPSGKDQMHPAEMDEIAAQNFSEVKNKPCPMGFEFKDEGTKFDDLIAGWVQYWNEVLKPTEALDPNLAKALIASESRFNPNLLANKKDANSARGLTQITNDTRKILQDEKGELKDHYLFATREELNDPNVNICAGIRWLFHKRDLASHELGRQATWEESIAKYKSIFKELQKGQPRANELMKRFLHYLEEFSKCGKS